MHSIFLKVIYFFAMTMDRLQTPLLNKKHEPIK